MARRFKPGRRLFESDGSEIEEQGKREFQEPKRALSREEQESRGNRRRFISRTLELCSTIPLGFVLASNFQKNRTYYDLDSSDAGVTKHPDVVRQFYSMQQGFQNSIKNLDSKYENAYHKSRVETYQETESYTERDGDNVVTKERQVSKERTVWYWDEEYGIPDHNEVNDWKNSQDRLSKKADSLVSDQLIDVTRIENIGIEEKQAGKISQGVLNVSVYAPQVYLLLRYEEILARQKYTGRERKSVSEKVREVYSDKQTRRRSFLKIGAALAGACVAGKLGKYNDEKLKQGKSDLEKEIDDATVLTDVSPGEAFRGHFGDSYQLLIRRVEEEIGVARKTLREGVRNKKVNQAFRQVVSSGTQYVQNLREMFKKGVPEELSFIAQCASVTSKLNSASTKQVTYANLGILGEGLAVGGTMAAILVSSEILNHKFP